MTEPDDQVVSDLSSLELEQVESVSWALLREGAATATSPFRLPVLATSSAGGVDARVLVLRQADESCKTLEFHTDRRSSKVEQIRNASEVMWVFYDPARKVQIRIKSSGDCFESGRLVEDAWGSLSDHTKRAYAQELKPGTAVSTIRHGAPCAHVENPEEGRQNFAVVVCRVRRIEWLALSRAGHQCALMQSTPEGWSSTWVMP